MGWNAVKDEVSLISAFIVLKADDLIEEMVELKGRKRRKSCLKFSSRDKDAEPRVDPTLKVSVPVQSCSENLTKLCRSSHYHV